ncbi:hypothetical protein PFNF135_06249, partial [Plasmodium falciparum NF135/5.C10]
MFYTLGDYRDIVVRGVADDTKDANNIVVNASDDKETMQKIQEKIKQILPTSGSSPSPSEKNSGTTPQEWWQKNGEHIWNGMICALTYKEDTSGEKNTDGTNKIEQNSDLKKALLDTDGNKPKKDKDHDYTYENVVLKDENSDTGARSGSSLNPETTKLKNFVERPPYFRYLEEWGESFCRERAKRLAQIKKDCYKNGGRCSGDGEECNDNLPEDPSNFPSFNCPSCATPCRKYKKWIERKKIEFEKQQKIYGEQKDKYEKESNCAERNDHGNRFCVTGGKCNTAASFLEKLASCKKDNKDNGKDKLDFNEPDETFKHTEYCDPCSQFSVNCKVTGNCDNNKGENCNGTTTITANHIGNGRNSAEELDMLVSDNSGKELYGLEACQHAGIFKGFRKDVWKCGNVCGYNVCKPENVSGKANGKNQIIIIRALFKRWLEYFLEDYNKIKKKLKACMKKGEGFTCIKDYDKNHKCVETWISTKRTEWKKIKDHYLEKKHEKGDRDMKSLVRNFLEEFEDRPEFKKAIKPCKGLTKFESFCGLNGDESSEKKGGKNSDIIDCMIKKLEEKATSCQEQHSGSEQCTTPPSNLEDDEEDLLLDEEENTVEAPKFCPEPEKEDVKEEDECKATGTPSKDEKTKGEEGAPAPPEPPAAEPERTEEAKPPESVEPAPGPPPSPPPPLPPLKTAL